MEPAPCSLRGYNIPNTMDFRQWGRCNIEPAYNNNKAVVYKNRSKAISKIEINESESNVDFVVNDKVLFSFIDILIVVIT